MNREELLALRTQILDATVPLVLESESLGDDKFSLILRLIHGGNATGEVYQKAYETAQAINDKEDRLSALLGLLDEVDIDLSDDQIEDNSNSNADEGAQTQIEEQPHDDEAEANSQN